MRILSWPHRGSNHRPCGSKSSSLTATLQDAPEQQSYKCKGNIGRLVALNMEMRQKNLQPESRGFSALVQQHSVRMKCFLNAAHLAHTCLPGSHQLSVVGDLTSLLAGGEVDSVAKEAPVKARHMSNLWSALGFLANHMRDTKMPTYVWLTRYSMDKREKTNKNTDKLKKPTTAPLTCAGQKQLSFKFRVCVCVCVCVCECVCVCVCVSSR